MNGSLDGFKFVEDGAQEHSRTGERSGQQERHRPPEVALKACATVIDNGSAAATSLGVIVAAVDERERQTGGPVGELGVQEGLAYVSDRANPGRAALGGQDRRNHAGPIAAKTPLDGRRAISVAVFLSVSLRLCPSGGFSVGVTACIGIVVEMVESERLD